MLSLSGQARRQRSTSEPGRLKYNFNAIPSLLGPLQRCLNLAVIYGGNKTDPGAVLHRTHNPRSWKSYRSVAEDIAQALTRLGFRNVHLLAENMTLGRDLARLEVDLAWLNSGGVQGYNPVCHLPAMLEMLGVPYLGHNPLLASVLDNKHAFKRELETAGLPTAPYVTWDRTRGPFRPDLNSRFRSAFSGHRGAFVVKPVSGRASLQVYVIDSVAELPKIVDKVYEATHNLVLIEPYLPGREFVVSVCGPVTSRRRQLTKSTEPFVFSCAERVLAPDERIFTSMDLRPVTRQRIKLVDPEREPLLLGELAFLASRTFLDFNLETLVRLDLRCDASGKLQILEANPKPDLTRPRGNKVSLVTSGLDAQGMDYEDLILSLIVNRLDFLMTHRPMTLGHIFDKIERAD